MTHSLTDVPGAIRRILRKVDFVAKKKLSEEGHPYNCYDEPVVAEVNDANVITSVVDAPRWDLLENVQERVGNVMKHAPVLDLDIPCTLLESSTPGHHHLIIDHPMEWHDYLNLMDAMVQAGILEQGYVDASRQRGYSSIRLPWVKRDPRTDTHNRSEVVSEKDTPGVASDIDLLDEL